MFRRNVPALAGLACLMVMAAAVTAKALMIAPAPIPLRVAGAGAVVVGKVTALAEKTEKAEMFKGDTRDMQVATVKVEQELLGKPGKEIKVAFFPPVAVRPGGGIRPPIRRFPSVQLVADQEALMLLTPHPTKKGVYMVGDYASVINKKDNPNFATELAEVKKATKILANPMAGLKSKDADERFLATALLITRYRTPTGGEMPKTETVTAEESKLLLKNLADADWSPMGGRLGFQMSPQNMFFRLGLTEKDGWVIKPGTNVQEAAKQWLKDNASKYRVVRYVRAGEGGGISAEP